jgi:hypothetical protein
MIRVKSWAAYKENWADLGECVVTVVIEALVGVGILCVLAIVILPALLMATVGYAPDAEGE